MPDFDPTKLTREQLIDFARHYGREAGRGAAQDAVALVSDRDRPLTIPEERMKDLAAEAAARAYEQSIVEFKRTLREISLNVDDPELAAKVRAALLFPASSWSFVKWAGATFIVAILGAFATLVAPWFSGRVR